jgi:hypothetical protein
MSDYELFESEHKPEEFVSAENPLDGRPERPWLILAAAMRLVIRPSVG